MNLPLDRQLHRYIYSIPHIQSAKKVMITKPTEMLPYIYRDVCTMITAFIIALCLNKCKLQAYIQGNCYKKQSKVSWEWRIANQRCQLQKKRENFGTNSTSTLCPLFQELASFSPLLLISSDHDGQTVIGRLAGQGAGLRAIHKSWLDSF